MKSLFQYPMSFFSSRRIKIVFGCLLTSLMLGGSTASADDGETRVIAGMRSAEIVIEELEYMVSELAEREDSWDNNIFPNIDIFLFGVDTGLPIRFDPIFSEAHGMELQPIIPITDLGEFLNDNLDPIGIIPKRDRRDRDLYELTGNVFEGWLRFLKDPDYAVIFPRKEAIPKGMEHPAELHKELVKKGYTFFAELDNTKTSPEVRKSAFDKMAKNTLEGIQKRPSESQNELELRKAALDQQLAMIEQYFVESSGMTVGSVIDKTKEAAIFALLFSALEDTQLQKDIERVNAEPSYFAAIQHVEKALLTTRIHFMLNEETTTKLKEVYQLSETVAKEEAEGNEDLSADEKESRTNLAGLMNKILTESAELKVIDSFVDVVPSGSSHAFVMGIRCKGQEEINSAIDELISDREEVKLTKEIAEVEGAKLHKLELGENAPEALKDLYGSGYDTVIIAVSDEAFWLSFGENAEKELSDRITNVKTASDVKSDGVIFSMDAQLTPLVKSLNGLLNDEESIIGSFYKEQQSKRIEQKKESEKEKEESEEERPAREAAESFLTFEWVDKIVGTMAGEDDTVKFVMQVDDGGSIVGSGAAHRGILKAVGVMIANFADDNLQ